MSEQGIIITQSRIKHSYAWNEIARASIVARMIFKGLGYAGTKASQKICTLEVSGRRFQFDISSVWPDFRETRLITAILSQYLDMEFIDERKPGFKVRKDDPIRNLKRNYRVREGIVVVGIILLLYLYIYMLDMVSN